MSFWNEKETAKKMIGISFFKDKYFSIMEDGYYYSISGEEWSKAHSVSYPVSYEPVFSYSIFDDLFLCFYRGVWKTEDWSLWERVGQEINSFVGAVKRGNGYLFFSSKKGIYESNDLMKYFRRKIIGIDIKVVIEWRVRIFIGGENGLWEVSFMSDDIKIEKVVKDVILSYCVWGRMLFLGSDKGRVFYTNTGGQWNYMNINGRTDSIRALSAFDNKLFVGCGNRIYVLGGEKKLPIQDDIFNSEIKQIVSSRLSVLLLTEYKLYSRKVIR